MSQYLFNIEIPESIQSHSVEEKPILGPKKIKYGCRNQVEIKVDCLDSLVPNDHRVRDVWEFVNKLDFLEFKNEIQVLEGCRGAPTIDPQILAALWLYATLEGICSARHIARLCEEHHVYMWICGGVSVSYHTLSDFRATGGDKLRKLLQESIALIWKAQIFQPETVAQDGTRVKANAGFDLYKREASLAEYLERANLHIANLEKEHLKNPSASTLREKSARLRAANERKMRVEQAQDELKHYKEGRVQSSKDNHKKFAQEEQDNLKASVADPESRKMKMGDGGYRLAYNVQFATETEKKVVLGVDVVNTLDPGTLVPMMREVEENLKKIGCPMPSNWLADSAYANKKDAEAAENEFPDVTLFSPPTSSDKKIDPTMPSKGDNAAMANLRLRMKTEESKKIYSKRCETAEFVNLVAKNCGMREFYTRGLEKARNSAILFAIAHNMTIFFSNM